MGVSRLDRFEPAAIVFGCALRLCLVLLAIPQTHTSWFLPFLTHALSAGTLDIWTSFLANGGVPEAFPYGPLYLAAFGPFVAVGQLIDGARGAGIGLSLAVFVMDAGLFALLRRLVDRARRPAVTLAYWLSPVVIYVCYWHGQLDVFPVLILTLSLLYLKKQDFLVSGFTLGAAVAAKLSMAVGAPFVWIYVTSARRMRSKAARVILGSIASVALLLAPFAISPGFRRMVLETPERNKAFVLAVSYGEGLQLYILPLVFAGLIFAAWRIRRFNFEVVFNLIGVAFSLLFLLTPASPGWALWLIPFLALHLSRSSAGGWVLGMTFATLFVAFNLTASSGAQIAGWDLAAPLDVGRLTGEPRLRNLLLTTYLAAGGAIIFQMLRDGVLQNPFYETTREPLMLGIAGDSGAGKDTLANSLADLFGHTSVALVSGDDYHIWDRHKPMWRALTHLNPKANNLRRFNEDALALGKGLPIRAPHYDHAVGRMTKPRTVRPTDVVIVAGLHALHTPSLNAAFDLKIFLAMNEDLRRYLKIRRDVTERGHSLEAVSRSIMVREADSERYIRSQRQNADLVLSLEPLDPRTLDLKALGQRDIRFALSVEVPAVQELSNLIRALTGIGGLGVVQVAAEAGRQRIIIEGDPTSDDIAAAARTLVPKMFDYLSLTPRWASGQRGIMQLVILDQVDQRLLGKKG